MTDSPVLLVEDDDSIALIVEAILSSAGQTINRAISQKRRSRLRQPARRL
ncbi:hypothetical protein [Asaia platycodi]|nr:hypothetical protein [Asaia platycodi]